MLNSNYRPLCGIEFPVFSNIQVYMQDFDLSDPYLPAALEGYTTPVRRLCRMLSRKVGTAWLTVDEKVVKAGTTQRRPYPHVDGRFMPESSRWGHDGPKWIHPGQPRMAVVVASSVPGCRAWRGTFDGEPTECGDLQHIASQLGEGELLPANQGYLLSPDCVHESMRFERDTPRQFLRIALPN